MAKVDGELAKKRGSRVKELLHDHQMRQFELADKMHVTPEHLNAILNGKRTLTLEHAQFIARMFDVQLEWVMGFSDFKTANDQFCASLDKMEESARVLHSVIRMVANSQGYEIEIVDTTEENQEISVDTDSLYYVFKKNGLVTAHLSLLDYTKLRDEIFHYAYYLIEKYYKTQERKVVEPYAMEQKSKEGQNNG